MATLELQQLCKSYGAVGVVKSIGLEVRDGELISLLGPSGCGKTTTLRLIAGFVESNAGRIMIGDDDVTREPPHRRDLGVVFQSYALFPHLSAFENIAFGLRQRKLPENEIKSRVGEVVELVRLGGLEARLPRELSGGQQQRVAIARALAIRPKVLLLDEPLSNLDAQLRSAVRREIRDLQTKLKITTILVTHDQEEAMAMGDRLAVMSQGEIQQVGSAEDLYENPSNRFVASFIGTGVLFEGRGQNGIFTTSSGLRIGMKTQSAVTAVMIRPEALRLTAAAADAIEATFEHVTYLGSSTEVGLTLANGDVLNAVLPTQMLRSIQAEPGRTCAVEIDPRSVVGLER